MHLIDSQNANEKNEWVAGDPTTGTPPTSGTAAWFNAIQFEIANYIASQGISLNKNDNNQLKAAIAHHLNQSISSALSGLELGDTGPGYIHPDVHPAQMITESSLKRFVSDAQINAWNSKANESHVHAASNITQDATHRFVTDNEKQAWNELKNNQISSVIGELIWEGYDRLSSPVTLTTSKTFSNFSYLSFFCSVSSDTFYAAPVLLPISRLPTGVQKRVAIGRDDIGVKIINDNTVIVSALEDATDNYMIEIRGFK